jgi:hypothetical protein
VSFGASLSRVERTTREPSAEASSKKVLKAPLPVATFVVVPPERW